MRRRRSATQIRDAVLQSVRFSPLRGELSSYRLHVLLAPHLGNQGADNSGWVDDFEGTALLFARRNGIALALACSAGWVKRSVGYVGSSDSWQDLKAHKKMTWEYTRADNGNVALAGEIDLRASGGELVLALGFGGDQAEAARTAIASLRTGFEKAKADYHSRSRRRRDRPGIDTTAMATASTRTDRRLTEPGLVVAGPC